MMMHSGVLPALPCELSWLSSIRSQQRRKEKLLYWECKNSERWEATWIQSTSFPGFLLRFLLTCQPSEIYFFHSISLSEALLVFLLDGSSLCDNNKFLGQNSKDFWPTPFIVNVEHFTNHPNISLPSNLHLCINLTLSQFFCIIFKELIHPGFDVWKICFSVLWLPTLNEGVLPLLVISTLDKCLNDEQLLYSHFSEFLFISNISERRGILFNEWRSPESTCRFHDCEYKFLRTLLCNYFISWSFDHDEMRKLPQTLMHSSSCFAACYKSTPLPLYCNIYHQGVN